jgi:phosphoethanolamine N-methyltransferase
VTTEEAPVFYPDFAKLEFLWGEGFLSPGGVDEIARIVEHADLRRRRMLDIGCGAGGPSVTLLERHGAASVTGVDPMAHLVAYCRERAQRLGLADRLDYVLWPGGPLPFGDESFDAVFSKDAILHESDKAGLFAEIFRVLRPGGRLLMSDWLRGEGEDLDADVEALSHGVWTMWTLAQTVALLESIGFVVDDTENRQAWYADLCAEEVARFDGEWGARFAERFGQESLESLREEWVEFAGVSRSGALSPGHVRATRPAAGSPPR